MLIINELYIDKFFVVQVKIFNKYYDIIIIILYVIIIIIIIVIVII